jgi:Fic family protein
MERLVSAFHAATLAHLYIAWIHPFGDGNGRTARLVESAILANSGMVPSISVSLLSNHYNATRTEYYRKISASSQTESGVTDFQSYAARGLADQVAEQAGVVHAQNRMLAWRSYVHDVFAEQTQGEATHRRQALVLALPEGVPTPRSAIATLTSELAVAYANRSPKTISHDLNRLKELELIHGTTRAGFCPAISLMDGFIPAIKRQQASQG